MERQNLSEKPDDRKMVSYLLGTLGEAETEHFDELSVASDTFAARLRAVEDDLVDAYARAELSGEILDSFRTHYLASQRRRDRVRFAQDFVSLTGLGPATPKSASERVRPPRHRTAGEGLRSFRWFGLRAPNWAFA